MTSGHRDDLVDAVTWLGVEPTYRDVFGREHVAERGVLRTVGSVLAGGDAGVEGTTGERDLVALVADLRHDDADRLCGPVDVVWLPGPVEVVVRAGGRRGSLLVTATVDVRDADAAGERRTLEVPVADAGVPGSGVSGAGDATYIDLGPLGLPMGRHHVQVVSDAGEVGFTWLLVAPRRLASVGERGLGWGVFAPVWSAWTSARPEACFGALDDVAAWAGRHGASILGTLPLLSAFLDAPREPSPYSPVSRRHWNEALVDLDGMLGSMGGAALPTAVLEARRAVGAAVPVPAPWDAVGQWAAVRPVLAALADHVRVTPALRARIDDAVADDPERLSYARFRAYVDRAGSGWHGWDAPARQGELPIGGDDPGVWLWLVGQHEAATQVRHLADGLAARGQRLYLDLAVGCHPEGFDTWIDPELFGWGASVGAPPDEVFTGGQDWGFPPVRPRVARERGHADVVAALAAHLSVCDVLRLDHVMGLQRLFWVPAGAGPSSGVYVRQPLDELLAVLMIEATRADAVVVGENLGTVDPMMVEAMERTGLLGMHVGQFAVPDEPGLPLDDPGPAQLASLNTHDMPTFAGWIEGDDIDALRSLGLLDIRAATDARHRRASQVLALADALGVDPGDPEALLVAALEWLGRSPAPLVLVALDDLVSGREPLNLPGTPWTRPNWVVRLPMPFGDLLGDSSVAGVLDRLDAARSDPGHGPGGGDTGDATGRR